MRIVLRSIVISMCAVLLCLVAAAETLGQAAVDYAITCPTCRISVDHVVALGAESDSVLLHKGTTLVRDSRGRYFATGIDGGSIVMFDASGVFVRAFGRAGGGPGEFGAAITSIAISADSLFVFSANRRVMVLSPQLSFIRTVTLNHVSRVDPVVVGTDGRMITSYPLSTPGSAGFPYHVVNDSGKVVQSFGASDPAVLPTRNPREPVVFEAGSFFVLAAQLDRVWTVNHEYRITSWPIAGGAGTALAVRAPWLANAEKLTADELKQIFESQVAAVNAGRPLQIPGATPGHGISLINIDAASNLAWLSVSVSFRKGSKPAGLEACKQRPWPIAPQLDICWGIEVIDLRQRRRIAWLDVDGHGRFIPHSDFYYTVREDSSGNFRINVFRARLQGRVPAAGHRAWGHPLHRRPV